ncbi:MAG TPA: hypothetical protein VIN37_09825 [Candidatus Limnocylindria bacterium]
MNDKKTPHNQEGRPPTHNTKETEERLGEKEHDHGPANKDRIEAKISTLKD